MRFIMSLISVLNLSFNLRKFIMLNSIFCLTKQVFWWGSLYLL
nr:MAG TPA: hypothetical protein [Caudoviricetes sp.]